MLRCSSCIQGTILLLLCTGPTPFSVVACLIIMKQMKRSNVLREHYGTDIELYYTILNYVTLSIDRV